MDADDDAVLVARLKKGELSAFDQLFTKYRIRLLQHLGLTLMPRRDAEDVIQEAFLRAFRGIASFREESTFFTWIFKIALNCALASKRLNDRRIPAVSSISRSDDEWDRSELLFGSDNPVDELQRKQSLDMIDAELSAMPEAFAETFMLREVYGLSYIQIAQKMHCSIGTVRSRLSRARHLISVSLAGT
jgi:RNA polymerase sigma-70 factor (ECF subfamily)